MSKEKTLNELLNEIISSTWLQSTHKTTDVPAYYLHLHEAKQSISELIKEVIGEYEESYTGGDKGYIEMHARNEMRYDQRQRAKELGVNL